MYPVSGYKITTPFGKKGAAWSLGWHTGDDFACPANTDVIAPAPGHVVRVAYDNAYGNYVLLQVTLGGVPYRLYLCHLTKALVRPGVQVSLGQHIGESGYTGNVRPKGPGGAHLHGEARKPPYGFNGRDIVNPKIIWNFTAKPVPPAKQLTYFDFCVWNIARERWYTPWTNRAKEIQRELRGPDGTGEASVFCFQELFENKAIDTVKMALPKFKNFSGKAGLEFFYDASPDRWEFVSGENLYSGIANRWIQRVVLRRIRTGQLVVFYNIHAPIKAEGSGAKAAYGAWVAEKLRKETLPVVVGGDTNAPSDNDAPKAQLRAAGYVSYKQQAVITDENVMEFIPKKQDLCDIRTRPSGIADVTGGEVDVSTNSLESDHRRIEARIVISP